LKAVTAPASAAQLQQEYMTNNYSEPQQTRKHNHNVVGIEYNGSIFNTLAN